MPRFSRSTELFLVFFSVIVSASCAYRSPEDVNRLKSEVLNSSRCEESGFCTMEFAPHQCSFGEKSIEASNRCQALRQLRRYACERGLEFHEAQVRCEGKKLVELEPACEDRTPCTREYVPHSCKFDGQAFEASNRCEALNKVREYACKKGLSFKAEDVSCQSLERK